jgi:TRAP-type C4-dicarboxylate transport system permease large subunit
MFTVCGILNCRTIEFTRASLPFLLAMVVFFAILIMLPSLALYLPGVLM